MRSALGTLVLAVVAILGLVAAGSMPIDIASSNVDCKADCQKRLRDKTELCDKIYNSKGSAHYHDTQWHKDCLSAAKSEFDSCLAACKGD